MRSKDLGYQFMINAVSESSFLEQVRSLSDTEQNILYIIALNLGLMDIGRLQSIAERLGLKNEREQSYTRVVLLQVLTRLENKLLLKSGERSVRMCSHNALRLAFSFCDQHQPLFQRYAILVAEFVNNELEHGAQSPFLLEAHLSGHDFDQHCFLRLILLGILLGDNDLAYLGINYFEDSSESTSLISPFYTLFQDSFEHYHLNFFKPDMLFSCFRYEFKAYLNLKPSLSLSLLENALLESLGDLEDISATGCLFEYYLLHSKYQKLDGLEDISSDYLVKQWVQAASLLLKGHHQKSVRIFLSSFGDQRFECLEKMVMKTPQLLPFFSCALLAHDNPELGRELSTILRKVFDKNFKNKIPKEWVWAKVLKGESESQRRPRQWFVAEHIKSQSVLDTFYILLIQYWFQLVETEVILDKVRGLISRLDNSGLSWLLVQSTALQNQLLNSQSTIHDDEWSVPMVVWYKPLPAWTWKMSSLESLSHNLIADCTLESSSDLSYQERLVWIFQQVRGHWQISCRVQKYGKSRWSKGRHLPLLKAKETAEKMDFLSPLDIKILAKVNLSLLPSLQGGRPDLECVFDLGEIFQMLSKHPSVYWEDDLDTPLRLSIGKTYLILHCSKEKITLSMFPRSIKNIQNNVFIEKGGDHSLTLYEIPEAAKRTIELLREPLVIPSQQMPRLVSTLPGLLLANDLKSNKVLDLNFPIYQHSPRLVLQCRSLEEEQYEFRLKVKPFEELERLEIPTQGFAYTIMTNETEQSVQLIRDIDVELALLSKLGESVPGFIEMFDEHFVWIGQGLEDCLHMLLQAQTASEIFGSDFEVEWSGGRKLKVKRIDEKDVSLRLSDNRDWFAIEGNIRFEQGNQKIEISYNELMTLHQPVKDCFKVSDGHYLIMSDALKKQFQALNGMSVSTEHGLRIHPLAMASFYLSDSQSALFQGDEHWVAKRQQFQSIKEFKASVPETLNAKLRDYQVEGFVWMSQLAQWGVGACLADDMGLGKTLQSLAVILHRVRKGCTLIVAPTSVCANWLWELNKFAPSLKVTHFQQPQDIDNLSDQSVVLCSYGLLNKYQSDFVQLSWATIILDEAQAIKNSNSKRAKSIFSLYGEFRVALTGTPIENHLGELWSLFNFLNPGLLGSFKDFQSRFITPIEKHNDEVKRFALNQMVRPFILRRLKKQVLQELPERTEIVLSVKQSHEEQLMYQSLQQQAVSRFHNELNLEHQKIEILAALTRLRRLCCHPKLIDPDSLLLSSKLLLLKELLIDLKENDHQVLIFSQFVDFLKIIRKTVSELNLNYCYLDGQTPQKKRQQQISTFQTGTIDVFLISLKAGGTGLNLTAADYVIHMDPWWNPAVEDQASDRAYRMGQTRPVTVYRLVTEDTLEHKIVELHESKRDLADSLLQGTEMSGKLSADELVSLISSSGPCGVA